VPGSLRSLSYVDVWTGSDFDTAAVDVSSQVDTVLYTTVRYISHAVSTLRVKTTCNQTFVHIFDKY